MNIKKKVYDLVSKHKTHDPFELAAALGVIVIKNKPLGGSKGYYKLINRRKVIFIDCNLEEWEKRVVCAHELAHAIFHPKVNCCFLQNYTLLSVNKIEIQANKFCAYLLLTDEILADCEGLTYKQIACLTSVPIEIVTLREI